MGKNPNFVGKDFFHNQMKEHHLCNEDVDDSVFQKILNLIFGEKTEGDQTVIQMAITT